VPSAIAELLGCLHDTGSTRSPNERSPGCGGGPAGEQRPQCITLPGERARDEPERRSPVSSPTRVDHPRDQDDRLLRQSVAGVTEPVEDERPPVCPRCQKRLVILATHRSQDASGRDIRRQLWGCPRGHATVYRTGGAFGGLELLPDVVP